MSDLETRIEELYARFGPGKPMGIPAVDTRHPHFFLHRNFLGEQDLLIIFNTKRCRYQCHFCGLPHKSSETWIPGADILAQFEYVMLEVKHSLGVLDRVTISNDGSVLDGTTFSIDALTSIASCTRKLKNVRRLLLETRMEFVTTEAIRAIQDANPAAKLNLLVGFESLDAHIRDVILHKREGIDEFLAGLDRAADCQVDLTAFILLKPSYAMTDEQAVQEANASIDFLVESCGARGVPVTIRLGLMYAAEGTPWAAQASACPEYRPPRLTDALMIASEWAAKGITVYLGLSLEGLAAARNSYQSREDYSKDLLQIAIPHNYGRLDLRSIERFS